MFQVKKETQKRKPVTGKEAEEEVVVTTIVVLGYAFQFEQSVIKDEDLRVVYPISQMDETEKTKSRVIHTLTYLVLVTIYVLSTLGAYSAKVCLFIVTNLVLRLALLYSGSKGTLTYLHDIVAYDMVTFYMLPSSIGRVATKERFVWFLALNIAAVLWMGTEQYDNLLRDIVYSIIATVFLVVGHLSMIISRLALVVFKSLLEDKFVIDTYIVPMKGLIREILEKIAE